VYDDWRAAAAAWTARDARRARSAPGARRVAADGGAEPAAGSAEAEAAAAAARRAPRLSAVTLAFLEASCRADPDVPEWRVFDVCALMRAQKERRREEALPRAQKSSHHVLGSIDPEAA
jgi:hypothetical protein